MRTREEESFRDRKVSRSPTVVQQPYIGWGDHTSEAERVADKAEKTRVQAEAAMELAAASTEATERRTTLAEVALCKLREFDPSYVADFVSEKQGAAELARQMRRAVFAPAGARAQEERHTVGAQLFPRARTAPVRAVVETRRRPQAARTLPRKVADVNL